MLLLPQNESQRLRGNGVKKDFVLNRPYRNRQKWEFDVIDRLGAFGCILKQPLVYSNGGLMKKKRFNT
jgi:hypothetical protein